MSLLLLLYCPSLFFFSFFFVCTARRAVVYTRGSRLLSISLLSLSELCHWEGELRLKTGSAVPPRQKKERKKEKRNPSTFHPQCVQAAPNDKRAPPPPQSPFLPLPAPLPFPSLKFWHRSFLFTPFTVRLAALGLGAEPWFREASKRAFRSLARPVR